MKVSTWLYFISSCLTHYTDDALSQTLLSHYQPDFRLSSQERTIVLHCVASKLMRFEYCLLQLCTCIHTCLYVFGSCAESWLKLIIRLDVVTMASSKECEIRAYSTRQWYISSDAFSIRIGSNEKSTAKSFRDSSTVVFAYFHCVSLWSSGKAILKNPPYMML